MSKKHDVHLYCTVRLRVGQFDGINNADACAIAEEAMWPHLNHIFDQHSFHGPLETDNGLKVQPEHAEFADDVTSYLVDVVGDDSYNESTTHIRLPKCECLRCGHITDYPVVMGEGLLCPECESMAISTKKSPTGAKIRRLLTLMDGKCLDNEDEIDDVAEAIVGLFAAAIL
jgi:hypothetical protein